MWNELYFSRRKSVLEKFVGLILDNLSEWVCRSCGHKIRNATELYSFIEQALCSTRVDEDLNCKDSEDGCKRQLATTERSKTKNILSEQTVNVTGAKLD